MTNRLAHSDSLYLRKHAENPVDWWPWCDEALAQAEQENKPIFLSIGYSSCHWCTVMEGEAFSNEAIAAYLNANFLPIKVDREERPDIDSIYMQALQMLTGQGGWPLNIFLTPDDRVPFYGGTYFSVEARYGRPGFRQVLIALREIFDTDPKKIASVKSQILDVLQSSAQLSAGGLDTAQLRSGIYACAKTLMPFDTGNRFPMIPYASLVLKGDRLLSAAEEIDEIDASPDAPPIDGQHLTFQRALSLVKGGIFDHVAGGFHRYTVDPTWTVPHFEKMLYDNGLIVEFLSDCWQFGERSEAIARAIDKTVDWLKREMRSPRGFFYAAQDADNFARADAVEPEEGDFYVWSYAELEKLLGKAELTELTSTFTVSRSGNFEGKNVLQRRDSRLLSSVLETALDKLFSSRYGTLPADTPTFGPAVDAQSATGNRWPGRIPPVTDTKMIVAWNALMISGLAKASAAFERLDYLALAIETAHYIQQNQQIEGKLYRLNYGGEAAVLAQAEDYALLIKALIDIQQACLKFADYRAQAADWLAEAIALQAQFDQTLGSDQGGYVNAVSEQLIVQERGYQDSALPAANGVAIASLVRLFLLTENLDYFTQAEAALVSFGSVIAKAPRACPSLLSALDWFVHPTLIRTSADLVADESLQKLSTAVIRIEDAGSLPSGTVALVCKGLVCQKPATSVEVMRSQIQQSQKFA